MGDKFNKREKIESYALPIRPQPINVNKKKGWTNGFKGVGKVSPSILLFRLLTSSSSTMGKEMKSSCWSMKKKVDAVSRQASFYFSLLSSCLDPSLHKANVNGIQTNDERVEKNKRLYPPLPRILVTRLLEED